MNGIRKVVRLPGNHGKPHAGQPATATFLDLGLYGIPQRIKDGAERFDTVTRVRRFEERVRSLGGFLHTYCDVFSTEEEFNEMFDHTRSVSSPRSVHGVWTECSGTIDRIGKGIAHDESLQKISFALRYEHA
jgi:hypothetical protein